MEQNTDIALSQASYAYGPGKGNRVIYVDNKMVLENQITTEDLLKMAEQPQKFRLSNHLVNKVKRIKGVSDHKVYQEESQWDDL